MKKPKQVKRSGKEWFNEVLDEKKRLAIPVGPRFQADVPEWTGPPQRKYKSICSKWIGTVIWPSANRDRESEVGRGRGEVQCDCNTPGSIMCVKGHIALKRACLHKGLGPAFESWRFDQMGEDVAKLWKHSEQHKFIQIVKENPISQGNNKFIKLALASFPSKSRKAIASYYFNVYLPRRISVKTRSAAARGAAASVDTDDDDEEEAAAAAAENCSKGSRKRRAAGVVAVPHSSKLVKAAGFLNGRR